MSPTTSSEPCCCRAVKRAAPEESTEEDTYDDSDLEEGSSSYGDGTAHSESSTEELEDEGLLGFSWTDAFPL